MVKNPPASARDVGLIPGSGRSPGEGSGNPLQYSCPGNSMELPRKSPVGYNPWGCKESDTTEELNDNTDGVVVKATAFHLSHQPHCLRMNELCFPGTT